MKTKSVGVRIPINLLEHIHREKPDFNLSLFVRNSLIKEFGSTEDKVDQILKLKEMDDKKIEEGMKK